MWPIQPFVQPALILFMTISTLKPWTKSGTQTVSGIYIHICLFQAQNSITLNTIKLIEFPKTKGVRCVTRHFQTGTLRKGTFCFVRCITGLNMDNHVNSALRYNFIILNLIISFSGVNWLEFCFLVDNRRPRHGGRGSQISPRMFSVLLVSLLHWGRRFLRFSWKIETLLVCVYLQYEFPP